MQEKRVVPNPPKPLVCIWCRQDNHGKCPGCDCSQVKHVLENVHGLRNL